MLKNKKLPQSILDLIQAFSKFPSVGPKTAEKYIFYLLNQPKEDLENLSKLIQALHDNIHLCKNCFNFTDKEHELCNICRDEKRDQSTICVVAKQQDLMLLEDINEYNGLYHVLQGLLNPLEGIEAQNLKIAELLKRLEKNQIKEVILALDADINGEATILYLERLIKEKFPNIIVSRLARGLPMGASLEYADEATLANALKGRIKK